MYPLTALVLLFGVTDVTYRAELQQRSRIDLGQLNGRWQVAQAICGGQDHTAQYQEMVLFLDGNAGWLQNINEHPKHPLVRISIPPCLDPDFLDKRAIDLNFSVAGKPTKAILILEDDKLTVAWSMKAGEAGQRRPKSFDRSDPDLFIAVLKKLPR